MCRYVTLLVIALLLAGCGKAGRLKEENEALKVEVGRYRAQSADSERRLDEERARTEGLNGSTDTARSIQLILACAVVILGCTLAGVLVARKGVHNGTQQG